MSLLVEGLDDHLSRHLVPHRRRMVGKAGDAKPDALVHCGFGFGVLGVNPVLDAIGWDPPRFMGTAFQNAWINELIWKAMLIWTGVDQYDQDSPPTAEAIEDHVADVVATKPFIVPSSIFDEVIQICSRLGIPL
jgi:hypothetical protein